MLTEQNGLHQLPGSPEHAPLACHFPPQVTSQTLLAQLMSLPPQHQTRLPANVHNILWIQLGSGAAENNGQPPKNRLSLHHTSLLL